MERPPRIVEYICLACGAQGTWRIDEGDSETIAGGGGEPLRCPRCGSLVRTVEREPAPKIEAVAK
jgi:DNA-directed RNA polymerase subunit RPC12/RpoP